MPPAAAPTQAPQASNSTEAMANLQNFSGSMPSPSQDYMTAASSLGVPQQQQQVSGLRRAITNTTNLLNNVPGSVMGRTANSLVTSAQANRQILNESAPIESTLKQQSADAANAQDTLKNLLGEAGQQATLTEQGNANKLASLKAIYDSLFGKEQAAANAQLEQQKLDLAKQGQQSNSDYLNALLGGAGGSTPSTPGLPQGMSQRSGGGYNFNFGNNPVSAATFAKLNGTNISDLLYTMAQGGDSYAANAYRDILNNNGNITPQLMNKYSSIFWGEIPKTSTPSRSSAPVNKSVQGVKSAFSGVSILPTNPMALR